MDSSKELIIPETIKSKIYTLRGVQVMLDKDLALLYEIKAIRLREQVKRNLNRFPHDFCFQMTGEEVDLMVSQNAIPSKKHLGGALPYAFTEQGVASLSGVLTSERAAEVNVNIMRAFVSMRKFIARNAGLFLRLDTVEQKQIEHDKNFEKIFAAIEDKSFQKKQGIFYDGQIFDAYLFVSDIVRSANKSIVLVDNYVDESVLTLFGKRSKNVSVTICTKEITKQLQLDLQKFNAQYQPIDVREFKQSHDRFMIIDEKDVYHFGASLKDLGKKWFAFSRFEKGAVEMLGRLK